MGMWITLPFLSCLILVSLLVAIPALRSLGMTEFFEHIYVLFPGSYVLFPGSYVLLPGSYVLFPGSWIAGG
jgi:hypothetical protein